MCSSITISLTEEKVPGCLPDSAIFEPVETQKEPWNLFTNWLLCRSAIVLSLITSDAFCHLLVTNLHLADYQRSPNQWVIGVEDCVDNPGNESTEKLKSRKRKFACHKREILHPVFLYHSDRIPSCWKSVKAGRHRFVTGNGMNYTSLCNDTSSKRLISNRLCQQALPGEAQSRASTNTHEFAFPRLPLRTIC